jgi:hypothetical protein
MGSERPATIALDVTLYEVVFLAARLPVNGILVACVFPGVLSLPCSCLDTRACDARSACIVEFSRGDLQAKTS